MGSGYKVGHRAQKGKILAAKELQVRNIITRKFQDAVSRFRTEASILARFTHPNIPKVHDYFSLRGAYYIVMEYIDGTTQ